MQPCVLLVAAFVACLVDSGSALPGYPHFCKAGIIQKIENIWAGQPPTGIIDYLRTVGEERIVLASNHYTSLFKKRHPKSKLRCFYSRWITNPQNGHERLMFAMVRFSNSKQKNVVEGGAIKIIEENGVTKCPNTVCNGRDILAKPDGFIKVRKDLINADGSFTDPSVNTRVQEAKAKAEEIGITIDKEIPHADCEAAEKAELHPEKYEEEEDDTT